MSHIKKILIIRFSSLGDIILSFPLIKKLKEKFQDSEVHFLTKKEYAEIVSVNPDIDKVFFLYESLWHTRANVRKEEYDLIIDIHKNIRSVFVSWLNGKKVRRYKKENLKKFLLVKFKRNLFKEITPVYKKYLLAVSEFLDSKDYDYSIIGLDFPKEKKLDYEYIVVSPSSRHFTKTYPADKFIEFINSNAGLNFVLVGDKSENDKKICDYIASNCSKVLNYCGQLNIKELASVIYNSDYVICNDSAILHLSEALGKNVVAVFGSTVKEFGFFPQLPGSKILEINNLKCRPCTHIGRESCPEKHFRCMMEIRLSE